MSFGIWQFGRSTVRLLYEQFYLLYGFGVCCGHNSTGNWRVVAHLILRLIQSWWREFSTTIEECWCYARALSLFDLWSLVIFFSKFFSTLRLVGACLSWCNLWSNRALVYSCSDNKVSLQYACVCIIKHGKMSAIVGAQQDKSLALVSVCVRNCRIKNEWGITRYSTPTLRTTLCQYILYYVAHRLKPG